MRRGTFAPAYPALKNRAKLILPLRGNHNLPAISLYAMKKIILFIAATLGVVSTSFAQPTDKYSQYIGKKYYLKRNLAFLLNTPKVYSNEILFANNCDRPRLNHSQYLVRGEGVEITAVEKADSYLR
ncbi:MAG TPA: hypothetical protein VEF04_11440, partial [Blastocatellia bacterium]|nr:hypothetical protein [Blastocatellia bacterium]